MAGEGCRLLLGAAVQPGVVAVLRALAVAWHDLVRLQVVRGRSGANQKPVSLHCARFANFGSLWKFELFSAGCGPLCCCESLSRIGGDLGKVEGRCVGVYGLCECGGMVCTVWKEMGSSCVYATAAVYGLSIVSCVVSGVKRGEWFL